MSMPTWISRILINSHFPINTMQGTPSRPWFRLATMVRPPPPPPPTQQQRQPDQAPPPPRPAFSIRPAFTQGPPNVVAPTSPPVTKATPSPSATAAASSPPLTISQPPSPLVLPPPQINQPDYKQKTVIMQEKPKGLDNGKHAPKSNNGSDSDDVGMMRRRIITLAGENKGAIMDLTPFSKKPAKKKDNPTSSSSDSDNKSGSNSEGKKKKKSKSPLMSAIMNSNVQGVNNSILYNCSTTHHDPGVHLSLSRKPNGGTR